MSIHTRIDNPLEIRRNILESALEVAETIKAFDRIKQIEDSELNIREQFLNNVKDFSNRVSELNKELPSLPAEFRRDKKIKGVEKESEARVEIEDISPGENIERDIFEIRKKMQELGIVK